MTDARTQPAPPLLRWATEEDKGKGFGVYEDGETIKIRDVERSLRNWNTLLPEDENCRVFVSRPAVIATLDLPGVAGEIYQQLNDEDWIHCGGGHSDWHDHYDGIVKDLILAVLEKRLA